MKSIIMSMHAWYKGFYCKLGGKSALHYIKCVVMNIRCRVSNNLITAGSDVTVTSQAKSAVNEEGSMSGFHAGDSTPSNASGR